MLALVLLAVPQAPQALDDAAFAAWQAHLAPQQSESRWAEIGWRQRLTDGLEQASQEQRPLLLWLMNGHPLGCT